MVICMVLLPYLKVGDSVLMDSCTTQCTCDADNTEAACLATQCQGAEVCSLGVDRQECICQEPNYLKDGQCTGGYPGILTW